MEAAHRTGWAGWAGWAGCSVPKSSVPFGRGPPDCGAAANKFPATSGDLRRVAPGSPAWRAPCASAGEVEVRRRPEEEHLGGPCVWLNGRKSAVSNSLGPNPNPTTNTSSTYVFIRGGVSCPWDEYRWGRPHLYSSGGVSYPWGVSRVGHSLPVCPRTQCFCTWARIQGGGRPPLYSSQG